jgi:hypothetical protein
LKLKATRTLDYLWTADYPAALSDDVLETGKCSGNTKSTTNERKTILWSLIPEILQAGNTLHH